MQGFELQSRRADGTVFPASLTSRLIEFQGETAVISGVLDLTEQKRAEAEIARQREALRRSEQRFRTIAEAHPVPVLIVRRADRRVLYASQPFLELMRVTPERVHSLTSADLFARDEESAHVADALRAGQVVENHEITVRRSDGSVLPAAITARPVEYEGEDAAVFGVVDLTEQKKAEAEIVRQREALHQSEKLNALGSLLANVAHELNNPLSVVLGYSTMLRDMAPDETTRQRAIKVHAGAERCARIVKTFLTMARRKPEAWTPVSLNQIIESALDVVGYGLRGADIAVDLDLASDLPAVSGDADQLNLVLMNLIVNAQHALQTRPPPRRLEIITRHQRRQGADRGGRQRPGHPGRHRRAHLRSVLHDQAAGRRHGHRPVGVPGDRHRAPRRDQRRLASARWRAVHRHLAGDDRRAEAEARSSRLPRRSPDGCWWSTTRWRSRRWSAKCSSVTITRCRSRPAAVRRSSTWRRIRPI